MRDMLAQATIAVCPVTVKVGIQNKVLEAMAMGLPVVSSRLGAEGLTAEDAVPEPLEEPADPGKGVGSATRSRT